jgi:hypothetical protein
MLVKLCAAEHGVEWRSIAVQPNAGADQGKAREWGQCERKSGRWTRKDSKRRNILEYAPF